MEQLLLKPEEASRVLAIGRSKVYELLASGALESIAIGRSRRIPAEALRRWVDRQREARPEPAPAEEYGAREQKRVSDARPSGNRSAA